MVSLLGESVTVPGNRGPRKIQGAPAGRGYDLDNIRVHELAHVANDMGGSGDACLAIGIQSTRHFSNQGRFDQRFVALYIDDDLVVMPAATAIHRHTCHRR